MTNTINIGGDTFSSGCELLDVTSLHRPDTDWRYRDANGHEHRWHTGAAPAVRYNPQSRYVVPTVLFVEDGRDEDDVPYWHSECIECGARVSPGYCADANQVFLPGLRWYTINGRSVDEAEFRRRYEAAITTGRRPIRFAPR